MAAIWMVLFYEFSQRKFGATRLRSKLAGKIMDVLSWLAPIRARPAKEQAEGCWTRTFLLNGPFM